MKNSGFAAATLVLISACGGGGGDSGGSASAAAPAPTTQLAAYIGNWASDCYDHAIDSAAISRPAGSSDSITISFKTDYYVNANCTGNIIGTETQSADATATYAGTVDSSIVFTQGAAAIPAKVDKVIASLPAHTVSITGTGVVHTVTNGQAQWCMDYGNGSSICINDEGTRPATSGVAGGLYLQAGVLYELTPSGSLYVVNERFNKK
jgi:hypothetical protein